MGIVALTILMLQIFEWSAMLLLVYSQKNKRIEEIMFETNYLPKELDSIHDFTPSQMNYTKKEKILKFFFIVLYVAALLCYIFSDAY